MRNTVYLRRPRLLVSGTSDAPDQPEVSNGWRTAKIVGGRNIRVRSVGYVNDAQVNDLDRAIVALDEEVRHVNAELFDKGDADDAKRDVRINGKRYGDLPGDKRGEYLTAFADFDQRWQNFLGGWRDWLGQNQGAASRAIADDVFATWLSKYEQARSLWTKDLGQETKSPAPHSKDLGGPGGGPEAGFKLPWWAYAAAGGVVLVLLAPSIASIASITAATRAA